MEREGLDRLSREELLELLSQQADLAEREAAIERRDEKIRALEDELLPRRNVHGSSVTAVIGAARPGLARPGRQHPEHPRRRVQFCPFTRYGRVSVDSCGEVWHSRAARGAILLAGQFMRPERPALILPAEPERQAMPAFVGALGSKVSAA